MLVLEALVFGLITTIIAWYTMFVRKRKRLYELAAKLDGPKGLPLLGNALDFYGLSHAGIFSVLQKLTSSFKSVSKIWMGPFCLIFVSSPQNLQTIFNSPHCVNKSVFYEMVPNKLGLLTSKADVWKVHRKFLNPSFHIKILHSLIPIFNEKAQILLGIIDQHVGKGEFDIFHCMSACTLETLFETAIGLKKDVQNDKDNDYLKQMHMAADILTTKLFSIWCQIDCIYKRTKTYQDEQKYVINGVCTIADQIMETKTKLLDEQSATLEDSEMDASFEFKSPQIFIDQILKLRKVLSMEEMKDEINTFIAAGHETSALTMSSFLLMMAMHPDIQEKILKELLEVCDKDNMNLNHITLSKLKYMDMCIKETMRLFPVLPVIGRQTDEEIELDDYTIPKDVNVMIPIFNIQRNPEYWGEDAGEFIPERFLPENIAKVEPYAYVPFGGGGRICIGMRYSMLNMKSILAYLVLNNKFTTNLKYKDLTFRLSISMKIVQKYMVKVEKR